MIGGWGIIEKQYWGGGGSLEQILEVLFLRGADNMEEKISCFVNRLCQTYLKLSSKTKWRKRRRRRRRGVRRRGGEGGEE